MRPLESPTSSIFRSPLTARLVTTPSRAALPPNIPTILPRKPSSLTLRLSRILTSARAGLAQSATSRASEHSFHTRFIESPSRRDQSLAEPYERPGSGCVKLPQHFHNGASAGPTDPG